MHEHLEALLTNPKDFDLNDAALIALRNAIVHYGRPGRSLPLKNSKDVKALLKRLHIRNVAATGDSDFKENETRWQPIGATFSKVWDLLGLLFSRQMREQVYDPVISELKEDLILARAQERSPNARRWIQACFLVRTALVFLECVRIALSRPLGRLLPIALKAWWGSLR